MTDKPQPGPCPCRCGAGVPKLKHHTALDIVWSTYYCTCGAKSMASHDSIALSLWDNYHGVRPNEIPGALKE